MKNKKLVSTLHTGGEGSQTQVEMKLSVQWCNKQQGPRFVFDCCIDAPEFLLKGSCVNGGTPGHVRR